MSKTAKPLCILAGQGQLPLQVAEAARQNGRAVLVFALKGSADADFSGFQLHGLGLGEVGRALKILQKHDCHEVCMIGAVVRPDLTSLKFDLGALKVVPEILSTVIGGDDEALAGIVRFLAKRDIAIVGAHEIAPDLTATNEVLTKTHPNKADQADIARALAAARAIGTLDIGQGAISVDGRVVALEAAEGTDRMLARVAELRSVGRLRWKGQKGVLVKCAKPQQDLRVDMPCIGPDTVLKAAEAGLHGIALHAGHVLLAERDKLIDVANAHGLFICGVTPEEQDKHDAR